MLITGSRIVAAIAILLPLSGAMAAGAQPAPAPVAAAPASRAPAAETRLSIGEIAARIGTAEARARRREAEEPAYVHTASARQAEPFGC